MALVTALCTLAAALALYCGTASAEENSAGEKIYHAKCARCHGNRGQGGEEHDDPLAGDKSVLELARLIERTMPKNEKQKCTAEESQAVARFVYDAFYSPAARVRNQPPRIQLSHLTVRQQQNVMADLVASFRGEPSIPSERGLKAFYCKGRDPDHDRVRDLVEPQVNADFADRAPHDGLDAHSFSVRWEGSVFAPETGDYTFVVRTEHAVRLWVNDWETPLIDRWVKSGADVEFTAVRRLLGGRWHSLRLDFSKARQGVSEAQNDKSKPAAKASVKLLWKPPAGLLEVIPQRRLSPALPPELFVLETAFPPDDRSEGYDRGVQVSKAWDTATTEAAIETTDYLLARLSSLAGFSPKDANARDRAREFCRKFAERALRAPLNDEEKEFYVDKHFTDSVDVESGLKRSLLLVLKSPRFLFREPSQRKGNPYDVASRLSLALCDSVPDDPLRSAAAANQLQTAEQVRAQALRLVEQPRAAAKLRQFFQRWLKVDQLTDLGKDPKQFFDFTPEVASDLRTSLELFVDEIVFGAQPDFRRLLTSDAIPLNGRLAKLYGVSLPAESPFQSMPLDPQNRSGVLTHPFLLSGFAYTGTSSPIHRGVFVSRSLLGRSLRPPPEAVAPLSPALAPDLTTRERVALQTKSEACMSCHSLINPLGFTLEHFDAVGRFRANEQGRPIDATGGYLTRTGQEVRFQGVRELAQFLAGSEEVHAAFVEQLFQHLVQQPIQAYGPNCLVELRTSFQQSGFHIRKLAADIAARAALP